LSSPVAEFYGTETAWRWGQ